MPNEPNPKHKQTQRPVQQQTQQLNRLKPNKQQRTQQPQISQMPNEPNPKHKQWQPNKQPQTQQLNRLKPRLKPNKRQQIQQLNKK